MAGKPSSAGPPTPTSGAAAPSHAPIVASSGPPAAGPPGAPPGAGRQMDPRIQQQRAHVQKKLRDVGRILVVMSGKGGVGKSTVAASLAMNLARRGNKVGLLDMDLTGPDLPRFLGVEDAEITGEGAMEPVQVTKNLVLMSLAYLLPDKNSAVVWRGPMKMGAIRQLITEVNWGKLDHLVIDLPPGTSDEPLSIAQSIPDADGVVIVTTPHSVSILDVRKSISFANQLGLHVLGVVENMSGLACPSCDHQIDLFGQGMGEDLAKETNVAFLGRVPIDPHAAGPDGAGTEPAMLRKGSPAAAAFEAVVDAVVREVEKRPRRDVPDPGTGPLKMA